MHALRQLDGQTLARNGGLVGKGVPLADRAVHGDRFTLPHNDDIADRDFGDGHLLRFPLPLDSDGVGRERAELLHLPARAALALVLQPLAQRHQCDDHRRRFKEERRLLGREDRHDEAVNKRYRRAHRDEGVHVGHQLDQRAHAADEKLIVDEQDDERQSRLEAVIPPAVRYGDAPHMPHGEVHFGQQQDERQEKPHAERQPLLFFDGDLPEVVRAVAERRDGAFDAPVRELFVIKLDLHALPHQGDRAILHAVQFFHRTLDARRACRARHTCDRILLFHDDCLIL